MKHLYDNLRGCAKEEEVKAEFCKFFKMKIFALRGIDHSTEEDYVKFYAAQGDRYDWDRAPSTPCPKLVEDVLEWCVATTPTSSHRANDGGGCRRYAPLPSSPCALSRLLRLPKETSNE